jgi:hypothetical protein
MNIGLGFSLFYLGSLCRRLCLGKGLGRVWARKIGRQEARFARRRSRFHLSYDGQVLRQGCLRIVTVQPRMMDKSLDKGV